MDYKRLYSRLKCHVLTIFDDEFINNNPSKKHLLHDFVIMDLEDQSELISQIHIRSQELAKLLTDFAAEVNQVFNQIAWKEEVALDDFESIFPILQDRTEQETLDRILQCYNSIEEAELINNYQFMYQYGLCISIPHCYNEMINDYDDGNNRRCKLRIYSDFTASTKERFEEILKMSDVDKTIICIVDNRLKDEYKAQEILDCISATDSEKMNVIGTVFTSKENVERVDERLYFVCTDKASPEKLSINIVRSAYHYFLARLQNEIVKHIAEAFKKARENKYIANFLSQRAVREGISDYQVIQNWIRLMYEVQSAKSDVTKRLISLAQIVGELDNEIEDIPSPFENLLLDELNTWEAFDYCINDYYLPPMPGDVFVADNNDVYVLIGQDCDMMMSQVRRRRIAAAELLPVKLVPINKPQKIFNDLEYVWISNFKNPQDDKIYCMQVDYKHRKYIDSRILDLSTYNSSGECSFRRTSIGISESAKEIIQPYLIKYYETLGEYFEAICTLREINAGAMTVIMQNEQYLFNLMDYNENEGTLYYPLKRLCRLKPSYVFYLYKLFLEYRGRQPFETINYAASITQNIEVNYAGKTAHLEVAVKMGSHSFDAKIERLQWYITKISLRDTLKNLGIQERIESDEEMLLLVEKEQLIHLENGKKMGKK